MQRPNLTKRFAAAASLLLHVFVLVLMPLVDARLEAAALGQVAHVEAEKDGGCAAPHNDLTCRVCRTLDSVSEPSQEPVKLIVRLATQPALPHQVTTQVTRAPCPTSLASRAPPVV
jgi:hypothetical protein